MNKKKIIIISVVVIVFVIAIVLLQVYYPSDQEIYDGNIKYLEEKKNLCESAGFVFEQEGELTNSEGVHIKCYELRNNVKVYQNWLDMEYI